MDYSLGALKLLCIQLKNARQAPSPKAFTLGGILFQRAWLQGVLISTPSSSHSGGEGFHLDDGTGVIELLLSGDLRNRNWETGMYLMVVGFYSIGNDGTSVLKVHKMVDLSPFPDRESMWYLEVIEVFKMFYQPIFQE
ncbi:Hypothetical predicted protein [Olea europaea subsp. europaea]|uniref:RecQ-mediated genome instability protein 2 n=1 Tax=Olea europaea subsp. europaea TaxID=158383 RepID=A0A8S0URW1_OLEEU|nr:Hypothetical predicted protein [Olea europaea subsp. europaea]